MPDKGGTGGQSKGGDASGGTGDSIQIKVGEEMVTLTPEQVAQTMEKVGNLEKTVESLSGFQKVLTQYGIGPEEYVKNSEAAFAIANSLIDQGIIDEQGNVVQKKVSDKKPDDDNKGFKFLGDERQTKQFGIIAKALETLTSRVEELDQGQSNIYRRNIKRDVQAIHSNLEDEDISKLLAQAQHDKSKGFWDHAKIMSEEKAAKATQMEKRFVKSTIQTLVKAGVIDKSKIDMEKLDSFDLNALKEQSDDGGAPVYEGKKFMFSSRKRRLKGREDLDKFSSPSGVTHEMFQKKGLSP